MGKFLPTCHHVETGPCREFLVPILNYSSHDSSRNCMVISPAESEWGLSVIVQVSLDIEALVLPLLCMCMLTCVFNMSVCVLVPAGQYFLEFECYKMLRCTIDWKVAIKITLCIFHVSSLLAVPCYIYLVLLGIKYGCLLLWVEWSSQRKSLNVARNGCWVGTAEQMTYFGRLWNS